MTARIGSAAVLVSVLAAAPGQAGFRVHPYLQNPAPDAVSILWFSDDPAPGAVSVEKPGGGTIELASQPVLAEALSYHPQERVTGAPPYAHRVRVTGLEPGTSYPYTVVQAGESHKAVLRAAPAHDSPVRFVVFSDMETEPGSTNHPGYWPDPDAPRRKYLVDQTEGYRQNLRVVAASNPDFVAIAGDLVEQGGRQRDWDEFWRHIAGEFGDLASSVPFLPTLGNHENYGGNGAMEEYSGGGPRRAVAKYRSYFEPPEATPADPVVHGRYWRMDYGPITLIAVDSSNGLPENSESDTNWYMDDPALDFNPGSAQYRWLEEQLASAQAHSRFTFVEFHHTPYSDGPHGFYPGQGNHPYGYNEQSGVPMRALTPLFLRYGVDAVLCGHDEMYERSRVLGSEVLPDGREVPHSVEFYDVGIAGDDLRGPERGKGGKYEFASHPWQMYLASRDEPEVWEGPVLREGGRHYGHLEVAVTPEAGHWQAKLTPVQVFPLMDASGSITGWERRVYRDEVVLSDAPGASAPVKEGRSGAPVDAESRPPIASSVAGAVRALRLAGLVPLALAVVALLASGLRAAPEQRRARLRLAAFLVAAGAAAAVLPGSRLGVPPPPLAEFQELRNLGRWLIGATAALSLYVVLGILLGRLVRRAFPPSPVTPATKVARKAVRKRRPRGLFAWLLAALVAVPIALLGAREPGAWAFAVSLPPLWLGAALGVWWGTSGRRGWSSALALLPRLALVGLGLAVAAVAAFFVLTEREPLFIELPPNTVADKRHIRDLFKGRNPLKLAPGMTSEVEVRQDDFDHMFAWGLALDGHDDRLARLELGEDRLTLHGSLRLPPSERYMNVSVGGFAAIDDGTLSFHGDTLRVGRVDLPGWAAGLASRFAIAAVESDVRSRILLAPVHNLRVTGDSVKISYGGVRLPKGFFGDILRGEGLMPQLVPPIRAQVAELIKAEPLPAADAKFGFALRTAFALAARRSRDGDPVAENKAAVLALGMFLGHWRVESLVGKIMDDDIRKAGLRRFAGTTIRDRSDWPKHYWVSAALVVLAAEGVSNAAGVLKEEMDSQGGSGFSFCDLLADESGTAFASLAIRDAESARAMQERLSSTEFVLDDYFPVAEGLPENIQDRDFELLYGGVGSVAYQQLMVEIQRRVAGCAAYEGLEPGNAG